MSALGRESGSVRLRDRGALNVTAGASNSGRLQYIAPGESIRALREEPGVVIPVFGARDYFERCLESVLRHTSSDVPIAGRGMP